MNLEFNLYPSEGQNESLVMLKAGRHQKTRKLLYVAAKQAKRLAKQALAGPAVKKEKVKKEKVQKEKVKTEKVKKVKLTKEELGRQDAKKSSASASFAYLTAASACNTALDSIANHLITTCRSSSLLPHPWRAKADRDQPPGDPPYRWIAECCSLVAAPRR